MPDLPNEERENRFVATGPNEGFSLRGTTGFFTDADKLDYGVNVQCNKCGVYGESVRVGHSSRTAPIDNDELVGVCGVGLTYGVYGRGNLRAGVYGEISIGGEVGRAGVAGQSVQIGVAGIHKALDKDSKPTDQGAGIIGVTDAGEGFGVVGLGVDTLHHKFSELGPSIVPQPFVDAQGKLVTQADGGGTGILGASGIGDGVRGESKSGTAVVANSDSGNGIEANTNSGAGVIGRSTDGVGGFFNSLNKEALVGISGGPGTGVRGTAPGSGIGVKGESTTGVGVFGDSAEKSGVVGRSRGKTAPGVFGTCENLTGVAGRSTHAPGVFGDSVNQAGVMGRAFAESAPGVFGFSDAKFKVPGPPAGVLGLNDNSVGVIGSSAKVIGVLGNTDKGLAVVGVANFGAGVPTDQITDQGIGVIGLANSGVGVAGMSTSGTGVFGSSSSKTGFAGQFKGAVTIEGDLTVIGGIKSAAVPHPDGSHRQLYCMESPESWFEDFGEAQLVNGKVEVRLDPGFAALVDVKGYHVFLTPYGESNGMFVAKRKATGFRVCEQQGGTSNVSFAYRVVAKRKDVVAKRLRTVTLPDTSNERKLPGLRLKIKSPDFKRLSVNPLDLPGPGSVK